MTTSEIKEANITQLEMRLVLMEYSTIPHQRAEAAAIIAEISRRKGG